MVLPALSPKSLQWQPAILTSIREQTSRVKSFFFKLPQPIRFIAGQHMDVRLTAPDGYQVQRSYSIASAPESSDDIELVIERLDEGEVSPFFHDIAQVGDEIELRGPIGGHFVWSVGDPGPVMLIGGGSGVVPLMSMIRHRAAKSSNVPASLLVSSRTWGDVIFRDELLRLSEADASFHCVFTTTRGARVRPVDYDRRVDPLMLSEVLAHMPGKPASVYVCGSDAFVEAAAQSLIESAVSADVIRTERYGG